MPYLGIKYSDLEIKATVDDEDTEIKLKADDNIGVFLGTDYKINDAWSLNIEARFIDETAMSFSAMYRF